MVTPLGMDVCNSCAAARAFITRATAVDWLGPGSDRAWGSEPLVAHAVRATVGFVGPGKTLALGALALSDLISHAQLSATDLARTGMFINLSDRYYEDAQALAVSEADPEVEPAPRPSEVWQQRTADLIPRLSRTCGWTLAADKQKLFYGGHAGFASALAAAIEHLGRGDFPQCIVGGIDSFVEPAALDAANAQGVLKANGRPVGFMPGEAAAFVLLKKTNGHRTRSGTAVAITATALAQGEAWSHSDPPKTANALTDAVARVISKAGCRSADVGLLIGDLNGQEIRAMEWGFALVHLTKRFVDQFDPRLWTAAGHFGEIGAATGPVSACMAVTALTRGYAESPAVVVWLSSDNGLKGAFLMERCN